MGLINKPRRTQVWNQTNLMIFIIITCSLLISSYVSATNPPDDLHTKTKQHEVTKRLLDSSYPSDANDTASLSSAQLTTSNDVIPATNGSISEPLPGPLDSNGGLLTDPSHPTFSPTPVSFPIVKPSALVTSPLLTATPSSPTGIQSNSSYDLESSKNKQNHSYSGTSGQHPILSGSMAIALPTPLVTSRPAQATPPPAAATNASVPLNSRPSSTVVVAVKEATPTLTTSTAFVYATNSPGSNNPASSSSNAPSTANSSAHILLASSIYSLVGLGLALLLVVPT